MSSDPIPSSDRAGPDRAPIRNPTEARQGAPAGRVRYVLVIGMVCVIIAFLLAYFGTRP